MKKLSIIVCILIYLSVLTSCFAYTNQDAKINVNLYYICETLQYNKADGLIAAEQRQVNNFISDDNWNSFINLYLAGPSDKDYISPFPDDTTLKRYLINGDIITLFLSNQITELEGFDLTLACACLAKTVLETKDVNTVEIRVEGGKMGNYNAITMTSESILLIDDYSNP